MSLGVSVFIVAIVVFLTWLASAAFGANIDLWQSLAISLVLTLVVNIVLSAFVSRRRRGPQYR